MRSDIRRKQRLHNQWVRFVINLSICARRHDSTFDSILRDITTTDGAVVVVAACNAGENVNLNQFGNVELKGMASMSFPHRTSAEVRSVPNHSFV